MASTPVSPKVTSSAFGGAVTTVIAYLLGNVIPFVQDWPTVVQGAVLVIVVTAGTWLAGWLKTDPLRNLGAGSSREAQRQNKVLDRLTSRLDRLEGSKEGGK